MQKFLSFFLAIILLLSCRSKTDKIHADIAARYTVEEINYFYECCFNSQSATTLNSWVKNIYFQLEGDVQADDSLVLRDLAGWFNAQNFSIRMQPAKDKQQANLHILFRYGLETYGFTTLCSQGIIDSAKVELRSSLQGEHRKSVLEHELLHAMGFCHVSTNYHSLMVDRGNIARFSDSPKEQTALKMLYGYEWSKMRHKGFFEEIFAEQLYHVNGIKKCCEYFKSANVSRHLVDTIYHYGTIQLKDSVRTLPPQIYKHAGGLELFVDGDVPALVLDSIKLMLQEFNCAATNLRLEYTTNKPLSGIHIHFTKDNTLPVNEFLFTELSNQISTAFQFNTIFSTTLTMHYNEQSTKAGRRLGNLLYNIISLRGDYSSHRETFESDSTGFHLKPFYRQLLQVYYSPQLPHNFTKSQLEEVMQLMETDSMRAK